MGKNNKIKDVVIKDEELESTTLGYLDDSKKGSGLLIAFFAIFIIFALFLPNITDIAKKIMGKDTQKIVLPSDETQNNKNPDVVSIEMYDLSDSLEFTYNNIKFSKFNKYSSNSKYYLSIYLENKSDKSIDFSSDRYYVELYSSDKTQLGRHIFTDYMLSANSNYTQTFEISESEYNSVSKVSIIKKEEKDYPDAGVKLDDNTNKYVLTCLNGPSKIVYTFDKDAKLEKIVETYTLDNDNTMTYSSLLSKYRAQASTYNNKAGAASNVVETTSGFTSTTEIDVNKVNVNELNNVNYYSNKKSINIVNFEMEARGYNCN